MESRGNGEQTRAVRTLLLEWDAIGIADVPEAMDEYDCMIGPLAGHLQRGTDAVSLRHWIARERVDRFGLAPDMGADRALADAPVAWWSGHTSHR